MANDEIIVRLARVVSQYTSEPRLVETRDLTQLFARLYLGQYDEVLSDFSGLFGATPSQSDGLRVAALEGALTGLKSVVGDDLSSLRETMRNWFTTNPLPPLPAPAPLPQTPLTPKRDVSNYFQWLSLVGIAGLFALGTWWLVHRDVAEMSIDIEWELGSMIQGVSVGFAAVLASLTYWYGRRGGPPREGGGGRSTLA